MVYVRWGHNTCLDTGAELVYTGRAGGSHYSHQGGGGNPQCLPKLLQDNKWVTELWIYVWSRVSRYKWTSSKFT